MSTPPPPPEPRYVQSEPLHLPLMDWGRACCILFLLVQLGLNLHLYSHQEPGWLLFLLLLHGLLPAVLMLFTSAQQDALRAWLRALAIAGLYILFIPFQLLGFQWVAYDNLPGVILIISSPTVHILWVIFALPYFILRAWAELKKGKKKPEKP